MEEPENGLPPSSDTADDWLKLAEEAFEKKLARYGKAHARQLDVLTYLQDLKDAQDGKLSPAYNDLGIVDPDENLGNLIGTLETCATWLLFRHQKKTGKRFLHKTNRCNKDLLCQFCAIQRGLRHLFHYMPRFRAVREAQPEEPWRVQLWIWLKLLRQQNKMPSYRKNLTGRWPLLWKGVYTGPRI